MAKSVVVVGSDRLNVERLTRSTVESSLETPSLLNLMSMWGISHKDVAVALNLTQSTVYAWSIGKRPIPREYTIMLLGYLRAMAPHVTSALRGASPVEKQFWRARVEAADRLIDAETLDDPEMQRAVDEVAKALRGRVGPLVADIVRAHNRERTDQ